MGGWALDGAVGRLGIVVCAFWARTSLAIPPALAIIDWLFFELRQSSLIAPTAFSLALEDAVSRRSSKGTMPAEEEHAR